jgi:ferric-dicitrate binding protein FerR (iron transport regulator)
MNDLITRVLSGEASDLEQQQVTRWRREAPENEKTYQGVEHVWRLSALQVRDEFISPPPNVTGIVSEAELRRDKVVPLEAPAKSRSGLWRWVLVAAAAVLVLSAWFFSLRESPDAVLTTGLGGTTLTSPTHTPSSRTASYWPE